MARTLAFQGGFLDCEKAEISADASKKNRRPKKKRVFGGNGNDHATMSASLLDRN